MNDEITACEIGTRTLEFVTRRLVWIADARMTVTYSQDQLEVARQAIAAMQVCAREALEHLAVHPVVVDIVHRERTRHATGY